MYYSNPALAVIGVASSIGNDLSTIQAAPAEGVDPHNGLSHSTIPGVHIQVYNFESGHASLVGPTATKPHLEFAVYGESLPR